MSTDRHGADRYAEPGAGTRTTEPTAEHATGSSTAYGETGAHEARVRREHGDFAAARDRVRWGPVWAGVVVTLASFILMQLGIFAAELFNEGGDAGTWLTAAAALVAFFLGGLVAGGTALWHGAGDGLVNGLVVWAVSVVSLLALALFGGGTLLGPISTVASDLVQVQNVNLQDVPTQQLDQALEGAREAARWALLGLALALASAGLGGVLGAKLWPSRDTASTTQRDAEGRTLDVR